MYSVYMISYVYEYWCIYDYMVVWVCMLYVIWCVVLCDIVSVVICMYMVILALCGYVMLWSQSDIYMCDMQILDAAWLEFFACSFEYYILWINYEHNMYDLCILYGWIVNI